MSIIRDRTEALGAARALVLAHPMCRRLEESEAAITVLFPEGDFRFHGVRCRVGRGGRTIAFETMLAHLEREWMLSYPGATRPQEETEE